MRVICKDDVGTPGNFVLLLDGNRWTFRVFDRRTERWASASWGSNPLSDGNWHHLAGVADSANARVTLFVDGKKRGTARWTADGLDDRDGTNLAIGMGSAGADTRHAFAGDIAEPVVFRRALATAEAAELARTPPTWEP